MDFQLSDEQRLISAAAREFADREIQPRVRDNDRAARFDRELASKLGEVCTETTVRAEESARPTCSTIRP